MYAYVTPPTYAQSSRCCSLCQGQSGIAWFPHSRLCVCVCVSQVFVEPEDVTNDFQPVMLVDADMDWAMKALLDWRVGVQWEKDKEATILGRLEKVCKGRKVPWTPAHFHGMAQAPIPDSDEALVSNAWSHRHRERDTHIVKPRHMGSRRRKPLDSSTTCSGHSRMRQKERCVYMCMCMCVFLCVCVCVCVQVEPDSSAATKTTATRTRAPVKKGKDSVKDSTAGKDSATPAAGGRKTRASRDAKESGTDLVPGLSAVKVGLEIDTYDRP